MSVRPTRHPTHSGRVCTIGPLTHSPQSRKVYREAHPTALGYILYGPVIERKVYQKPPKLSGTESTIVPLTHSSRSRLESTQKPIQQL